MLKQTVSRSELCRRRKKARELGCTVEDLPDLRGKHGNQVSGSANGRWTGGNPPDPKKRLANSIASARRYPHKLKARQAVHYAVRIGKLPHPTKCKCHDCGDLAASYDHHNGYDDPLNVQPVCFPCHGTRSRVRGEHKGKRRKKIPIPDDLMIREFPDAANAAIRKVREG